MSKPFKPCAAARLLALMSAVLGGLMTSGTRVPAAEKEASAKITYDDHVQPILREKCFSCHNPDKRSGDLDMTNYTNLLQGGGSGEVIEPGDASSSYLFMLVSHEDEPFMPPESPKLPDAMLESIAKWIDGGALENAGSTAPTVKKPMFDVAIAGAPTDRPAEPPLPARISLEPTCWTEAMTAVSAVAASPWAPLVAVASPKQVLLYHSQTLELVAVLPFPEGNAHVLKFSRNGSLLLAGGGRGAASGRVVVWNVKTGERVFEIGDELDAVLAADISADQTQIALGGPQRVVRVYSTETGELVRELRKHTDWIRAVSFSPDDVLLATADRNGGLLVWEAYTGREYGVLKGHGGAVTSVSWRADSNILASASEDGTIRLWEMEQGRQVKSFNAHGGGVACVKFTHDGRLVSCGRDRLAKLWDQNGKQLRAFEAFGDLALEVTFCNETARVVAGDWSGAVRVFAADDGAVAGSLSTNPPHLAERLESATSLLADKQAASTAQADAAQATQAEAEQARASLAAAEATAQDTQKQCDAATVAVKETKEKLAEATAAHDTAVKAASVLEAAIPLLSEAAEKAQQAALKLPDDEELAQAAAAVKAVLDRRVTELEAHRRAVKESAPVAEQSKQQLVAVERQLADSTAELQKLRQQVENLALPAKEVEEKASAAKAAADAVAQEVGAAQQQVDRWKEEIDFAKRFNELVEKRAEARDELAVRQAEHDQLATTAREAQAGADKLQAELASAQEAIVASQKQLEAARAEVEENKRWQAEVASAYQMAVQTVSSQEALLRLVKEALTKTDEAVDKSGGGGDLADAAAKLKTDVERRTKELEVALTRAKDMAGKLEQAKSLVAEAEKQLTETTTALKAANQRGQELPPVVEAAHKKAAVAKQAADKVAQGVSAAQQALDGINNEMAAAQGLNQPKADQEARTSSPS